MAVTSSATPMLVTYLNAHTTSLAFRDPRFCRAARASAWCYPDGMAVVWGARWHGHRVAERVNLGDFLPELLEELARREVPVAFVGSSPDVLRDFVAEMQKREPALRVVASHHGHFAEGSVEEGELTKELARSGTRVVFVGRGSPLQEDWALRCGPETGASVVWCVGALFEYFAGHRARAPQWVRRIGMEWLFRLMLEPRRLARRYLFGNVEFVWRVLRGRGIPG